MDRYIMVAEPLKKMGDAVRRINNLIDNGYEPLGAPTIGGPDRDGNEYFYQAMILWIPGK